MNSVNFGGGAYFVEAQFGGDYFGGYSYLAKAQFGGNALLVEVPLEAISTNFVFFFVDMFF